MLRIEIPSNGKSKLNFNKLEQYDIPAPRDGFDEEINTNVILNFEDEPEAIAYSQEIGEYGESLSDHSSEEYLITADIIKAIDDDEFVKSYGHRE